MKLEKNLRGHWVVFLLHTFCVHVCAMLIRFAFCNVSVLGNGSERTSEKKGMWSKLRLLRPDP